jgi:pseudouridine synthase
MRTRLQKLLSSAGVASRRGAEELIAQGRVTVNGRIARIGESADPEAGDVVLVDGRPLARRSVDHQYIAWHKPRGVVTSMRSTHGEPTVGDLLSLDRGVFPVGRLDRESSGLLLLTDDGAWGNLVTHPRYGVEKEYVTLVRGAPDSQVVRELERGIVLPDGTRTAPARVRRISENGHTSTLSITVIEGKKRQIRLMAAAVGHPVLELARIRIGPVRLGALREGQSRALTYQEVDGIREQARLATRESH